MLEYGVPCKTASPEKHGKGICPTLTLCQRCGGGRNLRQPGQPNLIIVVSERKSHLVFVLASHPLRFSSNCKAREPHFWLKPTLVHVTQRPCKESSMRHPQPKSAFLYFVVIYELCFVPAQSVTQVA